MARIQLLPMLLFMLMVTNHLLCTNALFGNKKKKEEEEKMKSSVGAGLDAIREMAHDPDAMRDALSAMKDPEIMKEVQKMSKDPAFIKEMERMMKDPMLVNAMDSAKDMFQDPQKAAQLLGQLQREAQTAVSGEAQQLSDAALGMAELSKAASNPKMLAEAMEMLKDPEIAAEVQQMMKDPSFQAEMKRYTDSPAFKASMERATKDIETLVNDPVKAQQLKAKAKQAGFI